MACGPRCHVQALTPPAPAVVPPRPAMLAPPRPAAAPPNGAPEKRGCSSVLSSVREPHAWSSTLSNGTQYARMSLEGSIAHAAQRVISCSAVVTASATSAGLIVQENDAE